METKNSEPKKISTRLFSIIPPICVSVGGGKGPTRVEADDPPSDTLLEDKSSLRLCHNA